MQLKGRVAIVTGASRGIGKAVAKLFAREGARVVVTARSEVASEHLPGTIHETAEEIHRAGGEALAIRCDVRKQEEVARMVARASERLGPVDILVNNAAATHPAPATELPIKRWDVIMDVNLRGTFVCTRAVLPQMQPRGSGAILNMTSAVGEMVGAPHAPGMPSLAYGVSKAAINKLTLGLAEELRPLGIAVNALMPGTPVATEGAVAFFGGKVDPSYTGPENIAQASLYLVQQSPETRTGWIGTDEELRDETRAW